MITQKIIRMPLAWRHYITVSLISVTILAHASVSAQAATACYAAVDCPGIYPIQASNQTLEHPSLMGCPSSWGLGSSASACEQVRPSLGAVTTPNGAPASPQSCGKEYSYAITWAVSNPCHIVYRSILGVDLPYWSVTYTPLPDPTTKAYVAACGGSGRGLSGGGVCVY
jgi:hypothetical protein